jgi:hypothetical protein
MELRGGILNIALKHGGCKANNFKGLDNYSEKALPDRKTYPSNSGG